MKPWEKYSEPKAAMPWEKYAEPQLDIAIEPTEQPIGQLPIDTVQPADVTTSQPSPEQFNPQAIETEGDIGLGVLAGAARFPLGVAYLGNEAFNALTDNDKNIVESFIKDNEAFIKEKNVGGPALVGEILGATGLGSIVTKGILKVGLAEGAIETTAGFGADRTPGEIATGALLAFTAGAGGTALINKLTTIDGKSQAAKYMQDLNQGRMTEEEFGKVIKGIPTDEQAIILAEGNQLYSQYFKGAIDKGDITAAQLGKRLEMRKNVIDQFAADDIKMAEASKQFGDMRKMIDTEAPASYTTTGIKDNIAALDTIYKTDPTPVGTTIRNLVLDVGDDMSISTALDLRENINAILRKPSISKNAKGNLINIKGNLDSFIDVSLKDRPDLIQIKDEAISNYREVVNDFQLGELIKKNTKNDFAVNWEGLRKDVKKNKLSSSNIDYAKPILKDFENRFINDKKLANLIVPSGAGQQNLLSLISKVYSGIIDVGHRLTRTDRAHGLVIQNEIRKSIGNKNNKHYNDFINDLMQNPKIPQEAKDSIQPIVDEIKLIEYKPDAKSTGDVNVQPISNIYQEPIIPTEEIIPTVEELKQIGYNRQAKVTGDINVKPIINILP